MDLLNHKYDAFATNKAIRFMERSIVLTPITAVINIARAVFKATKFNYVTDKSTSDFLCQKAWKQLMHGFKTYIPLIGFFLVIYPKIKEEKQIINYTISKIPF